MELEDVVTRRRSIRNFLDRPVSEEYVNELIEAARLAPSATNRQPWRFVILRETWEKEKISEAVTQSFVLQAPVILVCCLDRRAFTRELVTNRVEELVGIGVISREVAELLYRRKLPESSREAGLPFSAFIDMGIAVEHMVLRAADLGLGTCWVRMFDPQKMQQLLEIPSDLEITALLPVGYPEEEPGQRPRLKREDLIVQLPWQ